MNSHLRYYQIGKMPKEPSHSRIFNAVLPKRLQAYVHIVRDARPYLSELVIIWSVALCAVLVYSSYLLFGMFQHATDQYEKEVKALTYWEHVIHERPEYPGGYFQAGIHALRLRNTEKALTYFQQALLLDPNFAEAEVYAQEIRNAR